MTPTLVHRVRQGKPQEGAPLVVLLHGVGSHEDDLFALEAAFGPEFTVVSPRAPLTLRPGSYAWFPVQFTAEGPVIDAMAAETSRRTLLDFVDEMVRAQGADRSRVVLVGFSQGAIMAASLALTAPDRVAGVVLMSGRILPEVLPYVAPEEARKGPAYLIVHGTFDDRLPLAHGLASRQTLANLGIEAEFWEFPMGHTISEASLALVAGWVNSRFS